MKTNILKLTAILLILAGFFSCGKKTETTEEPIDAAIKEIIKNATNIEYEKYIEYIDDSLPDLPWLKETIEEYRNRIEAGYFEHVRIHQCTYRDGIGFLLNSCIECMDVGFGLIDVEGKFLCSDGGWVNTCGDYNVDYANTKLIWEIQPDPPVTIENLYEKPLDVISKSVQGKWKLHKFWGGMNHFYDGTTFVYISENGVAVLGKEGINFYFSYSWKKMEVSPPYPNIMPYTTYVMWNDKQNRGEWSFFALGSGMLEVNLYNSGVYTLIRVRDDVATIR